MGTTRFWLLLGMAAIAVAGWRMQLGMPAALTLKRGAAARIETISTGERVELVNRISLSGRTIVEFTADW
ncbi:MAG: hypothetical protein U1E76_07560 [Planctomycetota bacterium]